MEGSSDTSLRDIQIDLLQNQSKNCSDAASKPKKKRVENIRNSDIFVDDNNIYVYVDVELFKVHLEQKINIEAIKSLQIKYNPEAKLLEMQLPCLPKTTKQSTSDDAEKSTENTYQNHQYLWHLKRITDRCQLLIAGSDKSLPFEANYSYGFNSNYRGKISSEEHDLSKIHTISPLRRTIQREVDELTDFSRDEYKCDFVELQVPEGHENPMKYIFYYDDIKWSREEENLLHNLTINGDAENFENMDTAEIDCGLLNILMAICYDIRSTYNEPTCESGWTRSILSTVLHNFEPLNNMKNCVLSFLRRCLIYPLFRNYDLAWRCVEDTTKALQSKHASEWVLHQLIVTHTLFANSESNREHLNRYYINDYVRYVNFCSAQHLQMLARNLKNILFDVFKKHLGLDLVAIETEFLKELITDIRSNDGTSEEDDEDEDEEEEEEESELDDEDSIADDESSSSDTEENSVIEQRIDQLKI